MATELTTGLKPDESRRFSIPQPRLFLLAALVLFVVSIGLWFWLPIYRQQVAIDKIRRSGGMVSRVTDAPPWPWLRRWLVDERLRGFGKVTSVKFMGAPPPFIRGEPRTLVYAALTRLKDLRGLKLLDLQHAEVSDEGLIHLQDLPDLKWLNLDGRQITNAGLAHLQTLVNLECLILDSTQITDAGLSHLQTLTGLKDLRLGHTGVSDAGMAHLQALTNLQNLNLDSTQVTDAGLAHLQELKNLDSLTLDHTRITGAGLVHLQTLNNLHYVGLRDTEISDIGLSQLEKLTNLRALALDHTQLVDSDLVHLKRLPNLRGIWLIGTNVTEAGISDLKRHSHNWPSRNDCRRSARDRVTHSHEADPLAGYFLGGWGFGGLIGFKATATAVVAGLCRVSVRRPCVQQ